VDLPHGTPTAESTQSPRRLRETHFTSGALYTAFAKGAADGPKAYNSAVPRPLSRLPITKALQIAYRCADGKTQTYTSTAVSENGQQSNNVIVFDKQ
jgi:hypothetical protein